MLQPQLPLISLLLSPLHFVSLIDFDLLQMLEALVTEIDVSISLKPLKGF